MRIPWRRLGIAGATLLLLIGLGVTLLVVTNPRPGDAPGWEELSEMPDARGEVASAVDADLDGGVLYVAGGFGRIATTSDDVFAYRLREDRWDRLPRLPEARHHAAASVLGGELFVTGGAQGATDRSPHAEAWRLRAGRWESLEPMPEGRYAHRLVTVDGRLYAVGGTGPSARVLIWTPGEGWSRGAELPVARHHVAAVRREREIWVLGGRDGDDDPQSRVDVYDTRSDRWTRGPDLPLAVSAAAEGAIGGDIHLVGGEDPGVPGGGVIDRHLVLEGGSDDWRELDEPPLAVHGAAGGVLRGALIVAGGSSRQGLLSPLAWTGHTARFDPDSVRADRGYSGG